ncbi:TPA: non-canonical purine NTP pyrophosphatase [Candidatus Woesearchaeota archaeon]|nr:non-canonical purine NTP pyrophosphatase [Candidatus Woesearchaeota archaeon]
MKIKTKNGNSKMQNEQKLFFVTGNITKFNEAIQIIPELEMLSIELDEIQELDPHKVIKHKLNEAIKHHDNNRHKDAIFLVEDTSYYLVGMNGLPGPLAKWFKKALGLEGISKLTKVYGDQAIARSIIGCYHKGKIQFFEGELKGRIVFPRTGEGFGWDYIFVPYGETKTVSELGLQVKYKISMRSKAFQKLKEYLKIK